MKKIIMDEATRDEMERRGQSILDEERFNYAAGWDVRTQALGDDVDIVLLAPWGEWFGFTPDEARRIANAILSEIEIVEREERGEW